MLRYQPPPRALGLFRPLIALLIFAVSASAVGALAPIPVSPGGPQRPLLAAGPCPAFSWALGPELAGRPLDLVVYEVVAGGRGPDGDPLLGEAGPALRAQLPAGATSWTPPAGDCLEPGGTYGWTLRARVTGVSAGEGAGSWSRPWLFRIAEPGRAGGPAFGADPIDPDGAVAGAVRARRESAPARQADAATGGNAEAGGAASAAQGGTAAAFSDSAIDRSSAGAETFDIMNSGAGSMTLRVDGVDVVPQYFAGDQLELDGTTFNVLSAGLDADTLDGSDSSDFALAGDLGAHTADTGNPHGVTATQTTPATTSGDLEAYDGGAIVRVPVGADGQVLTADSGAAAGVAWADAAGGSLPRVAVVASSVGDYTDPVAAMADLASWCGTASQAAPCLLRIAPGLYDITTQLEMQPFVDIEGAGEEVTRIRSPGFPLAGSSATVAGADDAEIRHLAIENTGGDEAAYAMSSFGVSPRITHVTLIAAGGTTLTRGLLVASAGSPVLRSVTVEVTGGVAIAVSGAGSEPHMHGLEIEASGGTHNIGLDWDFNAAGSVRGARVVVGPGSGSQVGIDVGSLGNAAPLIQDSEIIVEGGSFTAGIRSIDGSPVLRDLIVTVSGGSGSTQGVGWSNDGVPILFGLDVTVSGGTDAVALRASFNNANTGTSTVHASSFTVNGGSTSNIGIVKGGSSAVLEVTSSSVRASGTASQTVDHNSGTTRIGATLLDGGGATTAGGLVCVESYDGAFTSLGSACT